MISQTSNDKTARVAKSLVPTVPLSLPIIAKGRGSIVWDTDGNQYIDCVTGYGAASIGHSNPALISSIETQLKEIVTCPAKFWTVPLLELTEELSKVLPRPLEKIYYCTTGAEAVEGAVKFAKKYSFATGKTGTCVVSLTHSFHGQLGLSATLTGQKKFKTGKGCFSNYPGVLHIPAPYCYRCHLEYPKCGIFCAKILNEIIDSRGAEDVSAVIYEPILGSGAIVPPKEYHSVISEICKANDIALILDEVITGFGRTGRLFGCQNWVLEPDIMTVGKGLGGGFPISAVITSDRIASSLKVSDHTSTFGGNPLACAAALGTLEVILQQNLVERALDVGSQMIKRFKELENENTLVGDVRGLGLLIGLELVTDKEKKTPASTEAKELRRRLLKEGVIIAVTGMYENIIRLQPALNISDEEVNRATDSISTCITHLTA